MKLTQDFCFAFAGGRREASDVLSCRGYVYGAVQNGMFRDSAHRKFQLLPATKFK
jgi:hypothetical protein